MHQKGRLLSKQIWSSSPLLSSGGIIAVKEVKDEEIFERAYRAVIDELGIAGFTWFIRLTQGGRGNWTEEREKALERFNNMLLEELVDHIKKHSKGPKKGQKVL